MAVIQVDSDRIVTYILLSGSAYVQSHCHIVEFGKVLSLFEIGFCPDFTIVVTKLWIVPNRR